MIEDNQKEKWRVYNTSREFGKDLKFNRKWYHLIAIFDQDRGEDFDFNNDIEPGEEFDFNQVIEPIIYSSEDDVVSMIKEESGDIVIEVNLLRRKFFE